MHDHAAGLVHGLAPIKQWAAWSVSGACCAGGWAAHAFASVRQPIAAVLPIAADWVPVLGPALGFATMVGYFATEVYRQRGESSRLRDELGRERAESLRLRGLVDAERRR